MIRLSLPGWPPSVNDSHFARGRRLKPETRAWIESAYFALQAQKSPQAPPIHPEALLGLEIRLYGPVLTKAGQPKRLDISNRIKLLEDVVADVFKFDDSRVFELSARKIENSLGKRTEIDLWVQNDIP